MSETATRQVGIAAGVAVGLVLLVSGGSVWRAASPGAPPRALARPPMVHPPPKWGKPGVLESRTPIPTTAGEGWRVINQYSAHRVLLLEVETDHVGHALGIAEDVIGGVKDAYSEVLVYFHRPKRTRVLASARVQWTPKNGYQLIKYEELSPEP
jgi:hypothetical protein